ncbi:hypothetical protein KUTeg_000393 [Tegillarca granosa]|uniref:Calponin-homology (CH) domain-containing protein n=1 Tax=Tegillarca granosa TaxID=220873 RepID=A0ABQ9FXE1_TEGGR|nr:hypothetical protein KUTeg_000393 [Tegillarca granosa]
MLVQTCLVTVIHSGKVRIVSRNTPRDNLDIPVIDDIIKDIGDGCALAVLVHFYCSHILKIDDICLKANIGIADSLHNLRLVRSFCNKHIPVKCFHLSYEDLLYTHNDLKQNIYVMISELFYWFELKKADCVLDAQRKEEETSIEHSALPPRSSSHTGIPQVPISNATKRSFHKHIMDDQRLSQTSHFIPPRQPLLHKRQQQSVDSPDTETGSQKYRRNPRRAQSLTSPQEREVIKQSVLAWEDSSKIHIRSQEHLAATDYNTSQNLLANVSIDSQLEDSFSDDRIEGLDLSGPSDSTPSPTPTFGMADSRQHKTVITPGHPDYLELESVTSGANSSRTYVCNDQPDKVEVKPEDFLPKMEPLLPARLKTAKEKINNHSKEEERGDTSERRKMRSPPKTKSSLSSSQVTDISDESGSISDVVTPLPDDQLSARDAISSPRQYSKGYVGFVMVGDPSKDVASVRSHSGSEKSVDTDKEIKASYTVTDHAYTSESARAAGIPVVDSTEILTHQRRGSREGSVASSRSSGDFSDHESQKIHRDHKTRESENIKTLFSQNKDLFTVPKPVPKIIQKSPSKSKPLTTNFAEIKRLKQTIGKVDNSGYVYMQHGQEASNKDQRKSSIKDKSEKNKPEKKTSFAALPNQTTWQQTSSQKQAESDRMENGDDKQASGMEMSQIRLKLEEKRKLIERKKQTMELQQQKMRQRLGKTAFLHVVSKTKDDEASATGTGGISEQVNESQDASSGGDVERPSSLQTDMSSNNLTSTPQRAFSREGIQQTIENVRKKWFQEEPGSSIDQQEQMSSNIDNMRDKASAVHEEQMSYDRENVRDKTPVSREHVTSQPEFTVPKQIPQDLQQRETTQKPLKTDNIPRAQSPKQKIQESVRQVSQDHKETESDYNTSLDKLNQSLTDLQGEIMKLSLQKEHLKIVDTPKKDISDSKEQTMAQSRIMGDMQVPTPERIVLGMGTGDQYSSPTMPPPQPFIPQQPVVIQGQPGPILTCQNQFIPVSPATVQYPGYAPGHPIPPTYAHQSPYTPQNLPHGYTQSPPYPHHVIPPQLSPITSSPYAATVPYQPYSPATNTYTVPSSHSHHPNVSIATGHSGAQIYHPTSVHQPYSETVSRIPQNEPAIVTTQQSESERIKQLHGDSDETKNQNGFFVSFGDDSSNKKVKPNLSSSEVRSDARLKSQQKLESNSVLSNDTLSNEDTTSKMDSMLEQTTDVSNLSNADDHSLSQNTSGIGFVIGDEPTAEDEMYRKKEKLAQLQMKRREEQERKRQYKEIEMQRRKEREMIKKEEEERRKAEEKTRREMIFKQYQEKKRAAEDDIPKRKEKPSKPRPKSMFIKAKDGTISDEGSLENLSSKAFTIDHTGMFTYLLLLTSKPLISYSPVFNSTSVMSVVCPN